jgi:hypothetical protein
MLRIRKKYQPEGWYFYFWWAHQDLNLGPKDYESRHPKKIISNSRGYIS